MTDIDFEDPLTKLNTQLNKSMVLMDSVVESDTHQQKSNRSITINTKIQPASSPSNGTHGISRRSILKKSDKTNQQETDVETQNTERDKERLKNTHEGKLPTNLVSGPRPHCLEDLIREENLIVEPTSSAFSLDDLSDSEDIWIMDVPRTIDPQDLRGQTLVLGDKSKFKIKEERYCAVNHEIKHNVTCVFSTGKAKLRYKTVNVKAAGAISVRRKLSSTPKIKPIQVETSGVPFPKNLKIRHPLFGVSQEGKVKKGAIKHA